MCGRYSLFTEEEDRDIREIIAEVSRKHPAAVVKTGEIFPTNTVPVLISGRSGLEAEPLVWGFPDFRNKGVVINARSETAAQKPMFRSSLLDRRCVIPTTGFYEWKKGASKQKYLFRLPGINALYLAGFWNTFQGKPRYVILTANANPSVAGIHNRMPVVLREADRERWVRDTDWALDYMKTTLPGLESKTV